MNKPVIGYCPVCSDKLFVKTLRCKSCETEVTGDFTMSPFDYLTKEQKDFALVFLREQGNIKSVEKVLGISYPTVKKNLDELCNALSVKMDDVKENSLREDVKRRLKNGEITFEEAERILGEL